MENKFCYLKGIVECDSGRIQDCNNKRIVTCPLDEEKSVEKSRQKRSKKENKKENEKQAFCYLKGLVYCNAGRVQDCNIKRIEKCPLD